MLQSGDPTAEPGVAGPEHKVALDTALMAVTIDAAYSIRLEDRVGSITAGKDANLTVLDQDTYEVAPEKLRDVTVWGTMLDGRMQPVTSDRVAATAFVPDAGIQDAVAARLASLISNWHTPCEARFRPGGMPSGR